MDSKTVSSEPATALRSGQRSGPLITPYYFNQANGRPMHREQKGIVLRGLCGSLKEAFYPNYVYDIEAPKESAAKRQRYGPRNTPARGQALGRRVDRELLAEVKKRKRKQREGDSDAEPSSKRPRQHNFTEGILATLEKRGYSVARAQMPVGSIRNKLYTAVDLVLLEQGKDGVVLGEVKCREPHTLRQACKTSPRMEAPYESVANTIFHHDQLQLGLTRLLFEETLPHVKVLGSMLVYVHRTGVDTYPLESWVLGTDRAKTLAALAAHAHCVGRSPAGRGRGRRRSAVRGRGRGRRGRA